MASDSSFSFLTAGQMPGEPESPWYLDIGWLCEDTGFETQFDIMTGKADYIAWLRTENDR